jgi:hypothetical protein
LVSRHFYIVDGLRLVEHCGTYGHRAFDKMRNRRLLDFYIAAEYVLLKLDIVWHRLGCLAEA